MDREDGGTEDGQEIGAGSLSEFDAVYNQPMTTLDERIQEYADRKGLDWKAAHDYLIDFALNTIDARRKGGTKTGNRPEQEKHLKRARKARR